MRTIGIAAGLIACAFFAGCTSLPKLEGGRVSVVSANGKPTHAIDELAKIDIVYQLDPDNKGRCRRPVTVAKDDTQDLASMTSEIQCALHAFHSRAYYDQLKPEEKSALRVNNVAFAYMTKQTIRMGELTKRLDDVTLKFDSQYRDVLKKKLSDELLQTQLVDLVDRVKVAADNSDFLEFQRRRRNGVQSAFMAASDAACDLYKRDLNNFYSTSNFGFGSAATVMGGLGAIVTSEPTARALAAAAGITSGVHAEYNDAFFRNKVVEVLTKAMDISRGRKKEEIRRRSAQVLADYSMEDALGDAIVYNSQCSLVAGLQETSESLKTVSDPGLKWLANAFGGAASDEKLTKQLFLSLGASVGTVQTIQRTTEDQNAVVGGTGDGSNDAKRNGPVSDPRDLTTDADNADIAVTTRTKTTVKTAASTPAKTDKPAKAATPATPAASAASGAASGKR